MAFVEINPNYRELSASLGLATAEEFLALEGVVVSGHPDRHVVRVCLGTKSGSVPAFLKREHRIPWRDRMANAWSGYGFCSKSVREARGLHRLRAAGIGCPEWIAAGEDGAGRAFLLVRELTGAVELRTQLREQGAGSRGRRQLARQLGRALARLHGAGTSHGDLYSKHVLVGPEPGKIRWIDWPRACRAASVSWRRRCQDLAALHATLAAELASPGDRLLCLRAYLRASNLKRAIADADAAVAIQRAAEGLRRRRYVRELCNPPPPVVQRLIWLDGEALCVTPEFHAAWSGPFPEAMLLRHNDHIYPPERPAAVSLPGERVGLLVRRDCLRPVASLWGWLRGKRPAAPEVGDAALLFRLERHRLAAPRLLAYGQCVVARGRVRSFLLMEPVAGSLSVAAWSAQSPEAARPRVVRRLVRQAGELLRRLHEAGCGRRCQAVGSSFPLRIVENPAAEPEVVLGDVNGLCLSRRLRRARRLADLVALSRELAPLVTGTTDALRLVLAYLGSERLTAEGKRLVRRLRRDVRSLGTSGGMHGKIDGTGPVQPRVTPAPRLPAWG